jgi:hypothetical protein
MKTVQGQQLVESIHHLMRKARRGLVLVSPYFDPWEELAEYIETALDRGVRVMIVVREGQQNAEEAAEDFEDRGAIIRSVPDLHAKLYFSELAYSGHREHPDRGIVNTWFTIEVGAKRRALRVSVVGTGFSSLGAFGAYATSPHGSTAGDLLRGLAA